MSSKAEVAADLEPARKILAARQKATADELIPILQEIQEAYGYLPADVLRWVSARTGIPASRIYGVVTFYAQFFLKPHGRHTVTCCRGTACHVRGSKKIINAVKAQLGIEEGESTADMLFSFETVACMGACALSPVMVVNKTYYGKMTPRRAELILRQLAQGEKR
jgi:NADH-quinone oxidoreductase subunit E